MTDNLNIISSKVVGVEWDRFWEQNMIPDESQKGTLILSIPYQDGGAEHTQLTKMLQACGLTTDSYHIIQVETGSSIPWHQLRDKLMPQQVLLLGVTPNQLGISALFRLNEPNRFNDCIWIPALSLSEMETQPEAKKALWLNALKPVFVDKAFENKH